MISCVFEETVVFAFVVLKRASVRGSSKMIAIIESAIIGLSWWLMTVHSVGLPVVKAV